MNTQAVIQSFQCRLFGLPVGEGWNREWEYQQQRGFSHDGISGTLKAEILSSVAMAGRCDQDLLSIPACPPSNQHKKGGPNFGPPFV
jgi:hypothetical protein